MEGRRIEPGRKQGLLELKVNPNSIIPDAIIFNEILPKLPIKSLVRFKSVSKLWLSTISSPKFAKFLLQLSNSKPHNHGFLMQSNFSVYAVPNFKCYDGTENFDIESIKMRLDDCGLTIEGMDIVGSCNGLICYLCYHYVSVWNPFTRECRKIVGFRHKGIVKFSPAYWAFGYVPSLDDYKIVNLSFAVNLNADRRSVTLTYVYSLKSNEWKGFETEPLETESTKDFVFGVVLANGKSHWFESRHIIAFDMETNAITAVPLPQEFNVDEMSDLRQRSCIGTMEEDLCIATQDSEQCLLVWVFKCCGEPGSWTKVLKLCDLPCPVSGTIKSFALCRYGEDNKLMIHLNEEVLVYYLSDSSPKCVQVASGVRHTKQYVESLVSPFMVEAARD